MHHFLPACEAITMSLKSNIPYFAQQYTLYCSAIYPILVSNIPYIAFYPNRNRLIVTHKQQRCDALRQFSYLMTAQLPKML